MPALSGAPAESLNKGGVFQTPDSNFNERLISKLPDCEWQFALATAVFSPDVRQHGCVTVLVFIHSERSLMPSSAHCCDLFLRRVQTALSSWPSHCYLHWSRNHRGNAAFITERIYLSFKQASKKHNASSSIKWKHCLLPKFSKLNGGY